MASMIPYGYNMDITQLGQAYNSSSDYVSWRDADANKDKTSLDFNDMLLLMVTQFQNQTIDNQASTSDMMNQLIQMTVMQAITSMSTQVDELTTANVMSYAASLVGKEVTLGVYDENGIVRELVGIVEGTGTYNGMPVIFVGGQSYFLSSIMGVGRLPSMDGDGTDTDTEVGDSVTELEDGTVITVHENKDEDGNVTSREITIDIPASEDGEREASQTVIRTNGTVSVNQVTGNVTCDATGEDGYVIIGSGEDAAEYKNCVITVNPSGEVMATTEEVSKTTLDDGTTITVRESKDSSGNVTSREVTINIPASEDGEREASWTIIRTDGAVSVDEETGYVTCGAGGSSVTVQTSRNSTSTTYENREITVKPSGEVVQE